MEPEQNNGMYQRGVVHKYGGTSVVTAKQDKRILESVVKMHKNRVPSDGYTVLVASGQGKIDDTPEGQKATDHMYDVINGRNPSKAWRIFRENQEKKLAEHQFPGEQAKLFLNHLFSSAQRVLDSGNIDAQGQSYIVSVPERVEMAILQTVGQALYPDEQFYLFDQYFGLLGDRRESFVDVPINHSASLTLIRQLAQRTEGGLEGKIILVPGFLGNFMDPGSKGPLAPITMERGSSDATATYWGAALDLDEVIIYSDRAGIMPVDPRIVPGLDPLQVLSYREARVFSGLGAKIIQKVAIKPAAEHNIPIWIRPSYNPDERGTSIGVCSPDLNHYGVKAIACESNFALLYVHDIEDKPGEAAKVQATFAEHNFNVAYEHDGDDFRVYAINPDQGFQAKLLNALASGGHRLELEFPVSRIALVGEGIPVYRKLHPRTSAKDVFTRTLTDNDVHIIAYNRIERGISISAFVPSRYEELALRKLAENFGFYQ
jgi:aspartate kinase